MINLLPIEDKILIRKEYLRRLSVIIGIFLFGFICIAAILLYPSYFLLVSQKKILENRLAVLQQSFEIKNADKAETLIRDLNGKLLFLSSEEKDFVPISVLTARILGNKSSAVKLNSFFYQGGEKTQKRFFLDGFSSTRPAFLAFVKSLEDMEEAEKVISPPSNILKEEKIDFNLIIELR
ncbi:MAG: hypothetical protein A3A10_02435 [Candidatus Tagabacteria bacterium RIFCSPLOWO2_01_FULL_42_9]|uniref:Uncharacterized protein n=1 Tax=Candidatus Tagabacteria bacterium RIFCSPLOWO2_01_FULL_42_9 TaxID=1802296 RepID=A0A1G2LTU6_9BACT|nr:MAG: hypothetical protein A3A10_02435 [Candidatus Tagabacteria bacterium RIFCSPLOWO2_01_FULL_42_9]